MTESPHSQIVKTHSVKLGTLFFYKDYVVTEFNEGVHITFHNFGECTNLIQEFYKEQPFGFIANRKNTYSIELTDASKFNKSFPQLKAYAVVCNSLFGRGNFEIENKFFDYNRNMFKTVEDAQNWVLKTLNRERELI